MDRDVIRGGTTGDDRLLLLARDRWPDAAPGTAVGIGTASVKRWARKR